MTTLGVRAHLVLRALRDRVARAGTERGVEAVQVALIGAALVAMCVLLIAALQGRFDPAIDEITGN